MIREEKVDNKFLEALGDLYTNSVTLRNFEIYRVDLTEIMNKDFI